MNSIMRTLFALFFYFVSLGQLFSHAGGGGGRGGGGGGGGHFGGGYSGRYGRGHKWTEADTYYLIIILIVIVIVCIIIWNAYRWLIRYRNAKANRQLIRSALNDTAWDKEKLRHLISEVYHKVQDAWMKQDMRLVQNIVTPQLQSHFQKILNLQRKRKFYNYIDKIDIREIRFVGLEDYTDNRLDNFTVYVSGYMIDLIVRHNRKVIKAEERTEFEDLYHFKREGDQWLVAEISTTVDIWSLMGLKVVAE